MPVRLEIVRDVGRWQAIEADWRDLYAVSPSASPPLTWEWTTLWWEVYGPRYGLTADALRIGCVWRDDQLVAALPLYLTKVPCPLSGTCLRFLSSGEEEFEETCADYLDLLYRPDDLTDALAALEPMLRGEQHCLMLSALDTRSPLAAWARELGQRGWWPREFSQGPCWVLELGGDYEAWLMSLSKASRRSCRQALDQAEAVGAVYERATTPDALQATFDDLVDLHQQRWSALGKAGCFAADRFLAFHHKLVAALGPDRALLSRLRVEGRTVAVNYGFRMGSRVDCYQAGTLVDPDLPIKSPGIAGYMYLCRDLAGEGVRTMDFLLGQAAHKDRLCEPRGELVTIKLAHPGLRAAVCHLRETARDWKRRLKAGRAK